MAMILAQQTVEAKAGSYAEFMKFIGDRQVKNPDTGRTVKYKSLKGPKGQELLKTEYERWKAKYHGGEEVSAEKESREEEDKSTKTPKSKPFKPLDLSTEASLESYAKKWDKTRTQWPKDQKEALKAYTGDDFVDINYGLRQGNVSAKSKATIEKMDKLFKSPLGKTDEDVTVYRRVGNTHPLLQLLEKGDLKAGMSYEDPGFMSTSVESGGFEGTTHGILHIDVPKGSQGVYVGQPPEDEYSLFSDEMEMVLNRGTKVEVTKIDGTHIYCKVVSQ